jgi:5'-nucleotidase
MKKIVAIDMDQVLADLLRVWVDVVNEKEKDSVKLDDIVCWDIYKYFRCGNKVYDYLDYQVFRNLPVIKGSQEVVKNLMNTYDVYIVTTATNHPESLLAKVEWLKEHFDFIPMDNVVLCGNKRIINADFMIDDGVHNLVTFKGEGILFDAPHNRNENRFKRVKNWYEIESFLLKKEINV